MAFLKYRFQEEFFDPLTGTRRDDGTSPRLFKTRNFGERLLHRVVRIVYVRKKDKDGEYVYERMGEAGGWVERHENLSQTGESWISGNAIVVGNATVSGDAKVSGEAEIGDNAVVSGGAEVTGLAAVAGNAMVFGEASVSGGDRIAVSGRAFVKGYVSDNARVSGASRILSGAKVGGMARVGGRAIVSGKVDGDALVTSHTFVGGEVTDRGLLTGDAVIFKNGIVKDDAISDGGYIDGEVGVNAVVGSGVADFVAEFIATKEDKSKGYYDFLWRRKSYHDAIEKRYAKGINEVMQSVWDKESGEQDNCGSFWRNSVWRLYPDAKPYDQRMDKWLFRNIKYDDHKEIAKEYGLEPDENGYVSVPCWEDASGEIHPFSFQTQKLMTYIDVSPYGRLGGGSGPIVSGGSVGDGTVLLKTVMTDGEISGSNSIIGNVDIKEGVIADNYNTISGSSVISGRIRGTCTTILNSIVYGTVDGRLYPSVTFDGNRQNIIDVCRIGEDSQTIGRFFLYDSVIDGIVAGIKKYKNFVTEQIGAYSGEDLNGDVISLLLEGEQIAGMRVVQKDMSSRQYEENGRSVKREEYLAESERYVFVVPKIDSRFTDQLFTTYEGLGTYGTTEYVIYAVKVHNKKEEEKLREWNEKGKS